MKIRTGFVSNSSTASFVVKYADLSALQLRQLMNYKETAEEMGVSFDDHWSVRDETTYVTGYTIMDNGDMKDFMDCIGIDQSIVEWDE